MHIGIQTSKIIDLTREPNPADIRAGFERIRSAGFDCVDFNVNECLSHEAIREGRMTGVFDLALPALRVYFEPYKQAARDCGIRFAQMHAPFPSITLQGEAVNAYIAMALEKCVALCAYLECPYLVVHPVLYEYEQQLDKGAEWETNLRLYGALIPALNEYGVTCCLENMIVYRKGYVYEASFANMLESCQCIDALNARAGAERFGFCLDTGHALLLGTDLYHAAGQLGSRLKAVHIHDNDGRKDQHFMPYMGIADWPRFLKGLAAVGFRGVLSFETVSVLTVFGPDLTDECLRLIGAIGKRFARMLREYAEGE